MLLVSVGAVAPLAIAATAPIETANVDDGGSEGTSDDATNGSVSAGPGSDNVTIDSTIRTAEGNTTVLVRFDGHPADAVDATDGSRTERIGSMRARANATRAAFERVAARTPGIEIDRRLWVVNGVVVTVDPDRVSIDRLARVANVTAIRSSTEVRTESATRSEDRRPAMRTDRPARSVAVSTTANASAGLETIRVPGTWDLYGTRGDGVRVAVLDTGVDPDHPDVTLADGGWAEFDERGVRLVSDPYDPNGHGTHVSGTVAGGNESGTAIGVAPEAELLHAKTFGADGSGTFRQISAGVQWAIENDADVVSMSFGANTKREEAFIDLVTSAETAGATVVAASGNNGANTSSSPGDVHESLTVGAVDDDAVAYFSGGETVHRDEWDSPPATWPDHYVVPDVVAPGVSVLSAVPDDGYDRFSGTSMATPHAAGVVALAIAAAERTGGGGERSTPATIREVIAESAVDLGDAPTRQGEGRIDAYGAVGAVGAPTCGRIAYAGTVELAGNLTGEDGCLVVGSDDVVIDGNGHTIDGTGVGIELAGEARSNVTIRNVTIAGTASPIATAGETAVSGVTLADVRTTDADDPIAIAAAGNVTLESVVVEGGTGTGIDVENASTATLSNVTVTGVDGDGIAVTNATTTGTGLEVDAGDAGLAVRGGSLAVAESDLRGTAGAGVRVRNVDRVTLTGTRVAGTPPLSAATAGDLEARDVTIDGGDAGNVEGVAVRGTNLSGSVSVPASAPAAPENETAVTGQVALSELSAPATVTLPYGLGERAVGTEITLKRHDGTGWTALLTERNRTVETVTAATGRDGVIGGYVVGDRLDPYRTDGRIDTRGLVSAIRDWRADRLRTVDLIAVIQAWRADRRR
ncbi:Right handed beta helix region [Halopenitus malekzadehii]|uniref:Right handed beta helix region n=2 Tax=Halopenitus malekzadehii TaxID=1267564 RepID=A0A1H6IV75_9EURY|nr:Right handed beta helix region [Halopenitus malekzadehii]